MNEQTESVLDVNLTSVGGPQSITVDTDSYTVFLRKEELPNLATKRMSDGVCTITFSYPGDEEPSDPIALAEHGHIKFRLGRRTHKLMELSIDMDGHATASDVQVRTDQDIELEEEKQRLDWAIKALDSLAEQKRAKSDFSSSVNISMLSSVLAEYRSKLAA